MSSPEPPPLRVLEQLGDELELAAARERPRRTLPAAARIALVAAALLFAITGAAGAARALLEEGATLAPAPGGSPDAHRKPLAGTTRLEPIRAHDPVDGAAWGIRTSIAREGAQCAAVGRVVNGRVGVLRGRVFHPLPPDAAGSCAGIGPRGAAPTWSQYPGPNVDVRRARTVVHGFVGRTATSVTVGPRGKTRTLEPTSRGAFLTVVAGLREPRQLPVTVSFGDGSSRTFAGDGEERSRGSDSSDAVAGERGRP